MEFTDFINKLKTIDSYVQFTNMIDEYSSINVLSNENLKILESMENERIRELSYKIGSKVSVDQLRKLDFRTFLSTIDIINWEHYTPEEHAEITNIYKEKSNLGNSVSVFEEREAVMNIINKMDQFEFLDKLYNNRLPIFMIATIYDADYRHILRDTNHVKPTAYSCAHRDRLRQMSRNEFMVSCMDETSLFYYQQRDSAMKEILSMEDDKFIEALKNLKLPKFIRAEYGDPDYEQLFTNYTTDSPESHALMHRVQLRCVEEEEYKLFSGI